MLLPVAVGDYTDFFSSMHHAKNCGTIFRGPQNPIPPNWYIGFDIFEYHPQLPLFLMLKNCHFISRFHIPIAYHGRASSIVISGTDIIRPRFEIISPKIIFIFSFCC